MRSSNLRIHLIPALILLAGLSTYAQKSFPGAEGYGSRTRGAYAGSSTPRVLYVDNLSSDIVSTGTDRGSLEWCITRPYPRIILFLVGGLIDYSGKKDQVQITESYCSIYGQSAPSPGITIYGCDFSVGKNDHDIVIQHLRIRPGSQLGYGDPENRDAFSCYGYNIMLDHCSLSWAIDENYATAPFTTHHITISNCLLSHPLQYANGGQDGYGLYLAMDSCVTYIKNLLAYSRDRNPRAQTEKLAYINNYNLAADFFCGPRIYPTKGNALQNHAYVNNIADYVGQGSSNYAFAKIYASHSEDGGATTNTDSKFYFSGNISPRSLSRPGMSDWQYVDKEVALKEQTTSPISLSGHNILPVSQLKDYLYANAGARPWDRDSYDQQVIDRVRAKEYWGGKLQFPKPVIASTQHVLSLPSDPHGDVNSNGFTNLEEWVFNMQKSNKLKGENSAPLIQGKTLTVRHDFPAGTEIHRFTISDPDQLQLHTLTIIDGNSEGYFNINNNGVLSVTQTNVLSQGYTYRLVVRVTDNAEVPLSDTAIMKIKVEIDECTVYIDPEHATGDIQNGTQAHPYRSWTSVTWTDGNCYLQKCGTVAHEESVTVGASRVKLGSYGSGAAPIIQSITNAFVFKFSDRKDIEIDNLHFSAPDALSCLYFTGPATENIHITHCSFDLAGNGVRIIEGNQILIRDNTFSGNTSGIYSLAASNKIFYNVFRNNNTAVEITSLLSAAEIFNNVFFGNQVSVAASYATLTLHNNVFRQTGNGTKALALTRANLTSDFNLFFPEQDGIIDQNDQSFASLLEFSQLTGADLHSLSVDPMFSDPVAGDFHLSIHSPAVDAGKTVGLSYDCESQPVPQGNATDIGAFESDLAAPVASHKSTFYAVLFPNPSNGKFTVSMPAEAKDCSIEIRNMAGKVVYLLKNIRGDAAFVDATFLPKGMYTIRVLGEGLSSVAKAVIF